MRETNANRLVVPLLRLLGSSQICDVLQIIHPLPERVTNLMPTPNPRCFASIFIAVLLLCSAQVLNASGQEPQAPDPAAMFESMGGNTKGANGPPRTPDISERTEDQVEAMLALAPPSNEAAAVPGLRPVMSSRFAIGDSLAVLLGSCACLCLLAPGGYVFYASMQRESLNLEVLGKGLCLLSILSLAWVLFIYSLAFSRNAHSYDAAAIEIEVMDREQAPGNLFIGDLNHAGFGGLASNWGAGRLRFPLRRPVDRVPHIYFMTLQMTIFLQAIVPLVVVSSVRVVDRWRVLPFWLMWSTFVYAPLCYWVQGGGWLADCLDSGCAIPNHLSIGFTALGLMLFKRQASESQTVMVNDIALSIGALLLIAGSLILAATRTMILHPWPTPYFLNMFLAGASGLLLWVGLQKRNARPGNWHDWPLGALSGLVAISPGCSLVEPGCAIIVGLVGALVSYMLIYSSTANRNNMLWLVFSIHGAGALVGLVLVGVFASADVAGIDVTGKAIMGLTSGNTEQIRTQVLTGGIAAVTALLGGILLPLLAMPIGVVLRVLFTPRAAVNVQGG